MSDHKPTPHYKDHHTPWKMHCIILDDGSTIPLHHLDESGRYIARQITLILNKLYWENPHGTNR